MHLICPPNFAQASFSISLGTAVIPRRNEEKTACKIWGGGGGGANKVYYGRCASNVWLSEVEIAKFLTKIEWKKHCLKERVSVRSKHLYG